MSEQKALMVQILMFVKLLNTSERKLFAFLMGHSRPYYM